MLPKNASPLCGFCCCFPVLLTDSYHLSSVKVLAFHGRLVFCRAGSPVPFFTESLTAAFLYLESALVSATFHDCQIDLPHHLSGPFGKMKSLRGPICGSARALDSLVRSSAVWTQKTEGISYVKAPRSSMWGLPQFVSVWKWKCKCMKEKKGAAYSELGDVKPRESFQKLRVPWIWVLHTVAPPPPPHSFLILWPFFRWSSQILQDIFIFKYIFIMRLQMSKIFKLFC